MSNPPLLLVLALLLSEPPAPPAAPEGLLEGPKVQDTGRGGKQDFAARPREPLANPRRWFALLDRIGLSQQQRSEVETIKGELRQAMAAFDEAHGERFRELARKAPVQPPGDQLSAPERRELQALREQRPRADEYLMRIWKLLDDGQQEQLQALLAEAQRNRRPGNRGGEVPEPARLGPVSQQRLEFLRRRRLPDRQTPAPPAQPAMPP